MIGWGFTKLIQPAPDVQNLETPSDTSFILAVFTETPVESVKSLPPTEPPLQVPVFAITTSYVCIYSDTTFTKCFLGIPGGTKIEIIKDQGSIFYVAVFSGNKRYEGYILKHGEYEYNAINGEYIYVSSNPFITATPTP